MFDLKTWLTGIGIALTIAGGVLVWKFSPAHVTGVDGNVNDTADQRGPRVNRKNKLQSAGGLLLLVGAVMQLVANFLPVG